MSKYHMLSPLDKKVEAEIFVRVWSFKIKKGSQFDLPDCIFVVIFVKYLYEEYISP